MDSGDQLPYYTIPDTPESFTANNVAARLVDGLGFRYYWGTEGLRSEDFQYKPSENGRTIEETMRHIYGLTRLVLNAVKSVPNGKSDADQLSAVELRTKTLMIIKETSDLLRAADADEMDNMQIIFQRGEKTSEYPFWNILNGPLADALWHVGQIVSHRRASGNPLSGNISLFSGSIRN